MAKKLKPNQSCKGETMEISKGGTQLIIEDRVDSDGDVRMQFDEPYCNGDIWINKDDAQEIIDHLKKVFGI